MDPENRDIVSLYRSVFGTKGSNKGLQIANKEWIMSGKLWIHLSILLFERIFHPFSNRRYFSPEYTFSFSKKFVMVFYLSIHYWFGITHRNEKTGITIEMSENNFGRNGLTTLQKILNETHCKSYIYFFTLVWPCRKNINHWKIIIFLFCIFLLKWD